MRGNGTVGGMRGGVQRRLGPQAGGGSTRGRASFPPPKAAGDKTGEVANPLFDSLYEPKFKSNSGDLRNSLFEKARNKLNTQESKGGRGMGHPKMASPMMGPPKKTWSN